MQKKSGTKGNKTIKPSGKPAKELTVKIPYVKYSTIWKAVGGGFSNPGESKVCKVGSHNVLVSRAEKLDRYGNPIHTATVIKKDGSLGASHRSTGSATMVVSQALRKNGIETKR